MRALQGGTISRQCFFGTTRSLAPPCRKASGHQQKNWISAAHVQAPAVTLPVKSLGAGETGEEQLALRVAPADSAVGLVHRHVVLIQQNARQGSASTKTRAEVRGGGKKPLQQKGSGNARLGSKRTPLRPGGGVVFGPKPVDWTIKMNKKERRLAIATALHSAAKSIIVVDDVKANVTGISTKALVGTLGKLDLDLTKQHILLIVEEITDALQKSARNIEKLVLADVANLSTYDILRADQLVIDRASLRHINEFYGEKQTATSAA